MRPETRIAIKRYQTEVKAEVDHIKRTTPCADCGRKYPPEVMDFDHVRGEKRAHVSVLLNQKMGRPIILEEIAKCDVVCANCHRIRTLKRIKEAVSEAQQDAGLDLFLFPD